MKERYDDNALRPAIHFLTDNERTNGTKALFVQSECINDEHRFAINRMTDGGKYIKGGKLCFTLNKVEIYADIDDIMFIDTTNLIVNISKSKGTMEVTDPEDPEKRQYILLLYLLNESDDRDDNYIWASMDGRTNTYNYIKDNIEVLEIDPDKSIVLTENVPYKDALTITEFVKYIQNGLVDNDDEFDIDEYKVI